MYSMMGWWGGKNLGLFYFLVFLNALPVIFPLLARVITAVFQPFRDAHDMHLKLKLQVLDIKNVAKPLRIWP